MNAEPLEIQRRIVDAAVKGSAFRPIMLFTTVYLAVTLAFGLIKLLTNVYRGWIAESAVRTLRLVIDRRVANRITLLRRVGRDILVVQPVSSGRNERQKFDLVFSLNVGVLKLKTTMNFLMNFTYSLGIVDPWNDLVDWARGLAVSSTKYRLVEQEVLRM